MVEFKYYKDRRLDGFREWFATADTHSGKIVSSTVLTDIKAKVQFILQNDLDISIGTADILHDIVELIDEKL